MAHYRKKPVVIEAWPISQIVRAAVQEWSALPEPVRDEYEKGNILFKPNGIEVKTLEGWMQGDLTSMLIHGVKGELYPCKADVFEITYDAQEVKP